LALKTGCDTMIHRQRRAKKGELLKIHPGGSMAPWTFTVNFPYDTIFIFGPLMFSTGEGRNLELLN
jgi:hypothetical protein